MFDLGGVFFEDGTKKFLNKLSSKTDKSLEELHPLFREGKSLEYRKNKITGIEFFKWAASELGNSISPEELNLMWVSEYVERPQIRDIIKSLKEKGIKITILSDNVPERIKYLQNKYHFLELFDDVVLSYQVNLIKDSPEMFNLALSRIKVNPNESIFIDDKQEKLDIANRLAINTLLFTNTDLLQTQLNNIISNS